MKTSIKQFLFWKRSIGFFFSVLCYTSLINAQEQNTLALSWERTNNAPNEIILGLHCRSDFSIDWGDGEWEEFSGRNYGVDGIRGTYKGDIVKIYGNPNDFISLYLGSEVRGNGIKFLDITRLKGLRFLHCPNNNLSHLDLSSNYLLEELHLANNNLQSLSLRQCPLLDMLICYNNELSELDLTENSKIQALRCENNQIPTLDLSHLSELTVLRCGNNPITQLDVSKNIKLQQLYVEGCLIHDVHTRSLADLRVLNVSECGLSQLDVGSNSVLHVLYANENELTDLSITQLLELEKLEVQNNQLQTLELKAPILTDLRCSGNELRAIDLSGTPMLRYLFCEQNRLQTIDLKHVPDLCELLASNNELSFLELSHNPNLYLLWLDGNQFAQLDISPCAAQLFSLFLANNRFPSSEIQCIVNQLPDITQISVSADKAWWKKWLRISGNQNVEQVDLTIPTQNGWHIDLTTQWPGKPSGISSMPYQASHTITQNGNQLYLSSADGQAIIFDIFSPSGEAIAHHLLKNGETTTCTLLTGFYIVVVQHLESNCQTVHKIVIH